MKINPQNWYWTREKWADDIVPANVRMIINVANKAIDEFANSNQNLTTEEMTAFCDDLWLEYKWTRLMPSEPQTYDFEKSDYTILLQRALSPDALQIDIDTLGEWMECWGEDQKLDENRYSLGNNRYLYPIYARWPDRHGCHSLLRYEIR